LVITVLCASGLLRSAELWFCDELFQRSETPPGDIVLVGITETDLQELGPYNTWDRTVMASALDALAADPDNLPAVVAIDTLYSGTTTTEADRKLADSAEGLGNVVTATEAQYGTQRTFGATILIDDYAILNYEEPYEALKNVTTQGHIHAMYDTDGVMRHAVLYIEPDGQKVYSMAYQVAAMYAAENGITIQDPPTDDRGRFYVSFTGAPTDYYDGVTLSMLINGEVPSTYFKDKIVLIGPYAPGLQDSYFTPVDRSEMMYGVEFQANVIQCLLEGDYKVEASDIFQIGALFIISFAFYFFCRNRRLLYTVPALIIGEVLAIGGALLLYSFGTIVHALWIPLALFVLFVVSVAGNYIRAALEKQNVTRTFERYVAPNVVGEILREGTDALKLGGKTVDIAVLFVDIRGFTTMSERMTPEEVVFILNQYLSMTSSCVEDNYGTLDKFIGDATMAFWGAPLKDEDPVYHAALAGLAIVDGAKKLSAKLKEEIGEEIRVGVGINYGPAVVGNMGSERRMDYTAIGDTVNTSARLEANAPASTIYISRSVADQLEGRMKFEPLEQPIKLKGKADGFEILRLIGPVDSEEKGEE
nr:adenylate/guanylate cyclase domain-containing protein [Saccharofermentans sp.]